MSPGLGDGADVDKAGEPILFSEPQPLGNLRIIAAPSCDDLRSKAKRLGGEHNMLHGDGGGEMLLDVGGDRVVGRGMGVGGEDGSAAQSFRALDLVLVGVVGGVLENPSKPVFRLLGEDDEALWSKGSVVGSAHRRGEDKLPLERVRSGVAELFGRM